MATGLKQKLKRIRNWARNWSKPCGAILLYHRIAEPAADPFRLCVTPGHFAEHLEVIRKFGRPVQLQRLTRDLRNGKRVRGNLAISFDDGYADNLHNAKPVLERFDIPATVFLSAGYIGLNRAFWWDELESLLLQPGSLPETLRVEIRGEIHTWHLGESARYTEQQWRQHQDWNFDLPETCGPTPRHRCFRSVWTRLQPLPFTEQQKLLNEIAAWAGAKPTGPPAPRPLTFQEIHQLVDGGLMTVGAHTKTHPALAKLPVATQRDEIAGGKKMLEDLLGHSIGQFAYPYGSYQAETIKIVQEAGFDSACSTIADFIRPNPNFFQLPRIAVEDCNGDEFEQLLKQVLNKF